MGRPKGAPMGGRRGTATRWARALLWRGVCELVGGRRVSGHPPRGPAVVVANHSSHADTALLLATLRPQDRPVVAAAMDYWFAVPWRRVLVTALVGAVPVRRDGPAYEAVLEAVRPFVEAGSQVVVFPEGTRSTDGQVAPFRSGALRLARDLGVPLVPVGLSGTERILPKAGALRPLGATVRIGTPVHGEALAALTADDLRERVCALRAGPDVPWVASPLWTALQGVPTRTMVGAGFAWGFAEALSWPVMAEMYLVWFAVPTPRRLAPLAGGVAAGSVAGVLVHAALSRRGVVLPAPLTRPRMHRTAADHLRASPWGITHQAFDGIPVKVYGRHAKVLGREQLPAFVLATALARPARILGAAAVLWPGARFLKPLVRHRYGGYLLVSGAVFALGLSRVVRRWE